MNEFEFPDLGSVDKAIEELKNIKFPKLEDFKDYISHADSISNILSSKLKIIPNLKRGSPITDFFPSVYRVRPFEEFQNIELFREHSYPPINYVKSGRCNYPNSPVFYCSNKPGVALLEVLDKNPNGKFCVSKWELIQSDNVIQHESFLNSELPNNSPYQNLAVNVNSNNSNNFLNSLSKEKQEVLISILRYLDNSFINDLDYSVSAALAYRSLFPQHKLPTDAILYPSAKSGRKGINIAFNPNFADNHLRIKKYTF